ncbi:hypothetical protein Tco_1009279 [Tanacetum coccineum]
MGYIHGINDAIKVTLFDVITVHLLVDHLKYFLYIELKSKSNSCCVVSDVSAGGGTFGTSFKLEGSLLWSVSHQNAWIPFLLHLVKIFTISGYVACAAKDVKVFETWFPVINDVIWCIFMSGDDE